MNLKPIHTINVIPLIDIMLVLLAIVLTTATFITQGTLNIDLPKGSSSQTLPKKAVEIAIDQGGTLFFGGERIAKEELQERLKLHPKESELILRADLASQFTHFVFVVDTLKKLGYENLSIVTSRE